MRTKKMQCLKILSILSLFCCIGVSTVTLSSCNKEPDIVFEVSSDFITLNVKEKATITTNSSGAVTFEILDPSIATLSTSQNTCVVTAKKVGATKIKVVQDGDEENAKYVFLNVVDTTSTKSYLTIDNSSELKFIKNIPVDLSSIEVILVNETTTNGSVVKDEINLSPNEYYFNIEDGHVFETETTFNLVITAKDDSVERFEIEVPVVTDLKAETVQLIDSLKGKNYTISFDGLLAGVQSIKGTIYFTDHYYINTYSENCFAEDENGTFKFSIDETKEGSSAIKTSNGYFPLGENETIFDALEKYNGIHYLDTFGELDQESVTVKNDIISVTDTKFLETFWNKTLGFNGGASKVEFSINDGSLAYSMIGKLSNGYELAFSGSIFDIGKTYNDNIEKFINDKNHKVGYVENKTFSSYVSNLRTNNYVIEAANVDIHTTSNYVAFVEKNNPEITGIIKKDMKVYEFSLNNGSVTLKNELETNQFDNTIYNLNNYNAFKNENLYKYYESTYYGSFVNFDVKDATQFKHLFSAYEKYEPYGIGLNESSSNKENLDLFYYFKTNSGLSLTSLTIKNFENANILELDNFLK